MAAEYGSMLEAHGRADEAVMEPPRRGVQAVAMVTGLCALALVGTVATWGDAGVGPVVLGRSFFTDHPDLPFGIPVVKPVKMTPWSPAPKTWSGDINLDAIPHKELAHPSPEDHVPEFLETVRKIMGADYGKDEDAAIDRKTTKLVGSASGEVYPDIAGSPVDEEEEHGQRGKRDMANSVAAKEVGDGGRADAEKVEVNKWEPLLVEGTFGEEVNDLTRGQLSRFKAMTCGVGACDKDLGCSNEAFKRCMSLEKDDRVKFLQAKLPFLRVLDGYVTQLPEDKAAEVSKEKDVEVKGKHETKEVKSLKWDKDHLAANCGAFACVPESGCNNGNFRMCMAEAPPDRAKEHMVTPEEQAEMVEKSDAQFMHLQAKAKRQGRGGSQVWGVGDEDPMSHNPLLGDAGMKPPTPDHVVE